VELEPEAAAEIVERLVVLLHGPDSEEGREVGPGWVVADEPDRPDALRGGEFDDAGFATATTVLADGRGTVSRLAGPGHLLRGSYRDRPSPSAMHLVVEPPPSAIAPTWRVSHLRIVPIEPRVWALRVAPSGETIGPIDPYDLVRGIAGAGSMARRLVGGTLTPSLIVEVSGR